MTTMTIQFANGRTQTLSARAILWRVALVALVPSILMMVPIRRIEGAHAAAVLRPTMERIADHGGAAADMWLIAHFGEEWRLPAAAAAGDPEALYLQGRMLTYRGHPRAGRRLIQRSAADGYSCAVMEQDLHRKNSVFSSCG